MSAEEHKALVRRFAEEVFDERNLAVMEELVAPDFVRHEPNALQGRAAWQQFIAMFFTAFPDLQVAVEDQFAEGDRVAIRWTARGTHREAVLGIAPTGKSVTFPGLTIYRIAGGRIAEGWEIVDTLGLMQQLGAIPVPTRAAV
jgi:steroid delta-isomerase-like uncharacterized protein